MTQTTKTGRLFHRLIAVNVLFFVLCGLLLPSVVNAEAGSRCPPAMNSYDCEAILGGWEHWVPDQAQTTSSCSSTGSSGGVPTLPAGERPKQAYVFFTQNMGLSAVQASVIIGTLRGESGTSLDPNSINSIGAYGIAQWLGGRRTNLENFAKAKGKEKNDFALQLAFVQNELEGAYKSSLARVKQAQSVTDINQAVYDFEATYEVSGHELIPDRQSFAHRVFEIYGGSTTSTDTTPVTGGQDSCGGQNQTSSTECEVNSVVYPAQYSQSQLSTLFGNPGTSTDHSQMEKNLVNVDYLGRSVRVHKLVAGCLTAVAEEIKAANVNYDVNVIGCYRYGQSVIGLGSYHSYGAACDINPSTNGVNASAHDIPQSYVDAFAHHGFTWGGSWASKKDWMHFEFHGIQP